MICIQRRSKPKSYIDILLLFIIKCQIFHSHKKVNLPNSLEMNFQVIGKHTSQDGRFGGRFDFKIFVFFIIK